MCAAVKARKNWKVGNTQVVRLDDGSVLVFLHGNRIYEEYSDGYKLASLAGWNTLTTRIRLRALGVSVEALTCGHQRKGEPCLNGQIISKYSWYEV